MCHTKPLPYEESLQWVAFPSVFHFVHNPSWKNLLPLLIHHKLWKGDPSLVQAYEDLSLLQCTYGLPIPLTHTTLNSTSSIVRNVPEASGRQLSGNVRMASTFFDHQRLSSLGDCIQFCSWQRRISWCRLVRSSAAHVDRNRFFYGETEL
jgi:hypothetical protein